MTFQCRMKERWFLKTLSQGPNQRYFPDRQEHMFAYLMHWKLRNENQKSIE